MTTPELEAEIARLYYGEHWKVGTIVAQLGTHPDVVRRVLGIGVARASAAPPRARLVDDYRAFIEETLARYPRLRATRLHDMVAARGYVGAVRTLRQYVAEVRPKPRREIYLRTAPRGGGGRRVAEWAGRAAACRKFAEGMRYVISQTRTGHARIGRSCLL